MTRIAKTQAALTRQLRELTDSKNELDWKIAAIAYAWTSTEGVLDSHKAAVFAAKKLPGFTQLDRVKAYISAYARAVNEGVALDVLPGDEIVIPTATFQTYYDRTDFRIKQKAKSIQGERAKTHVHDNKVIDAPKPARVSSNLERAQRILQEVDVMIKAESNKTGVAYQQLQFLRLEADAAVNVYKTAVLR